MRTAICAGTTALLILLTGCTGQDDPPATDGSATAPSSAEAPSGTAGTGGDPVDPSAYFIDPDDVTVLASGSIKSRSDGGGQVTAEVLSVDAADDGTVLQFRLSSTVQGDLDGAEGYTEIALVDRAAGEKLLPYQYERGKWSFVGQYETLVAYYSELGPTPIRLSILFPPLAAASTEVEVRIPGFPAMTVPVTRS